MAASTTVTLGVLHPGAMGATVGAAVQFRGVRSVWASEGRSPATATRLEQLKDDTTFSMDDVLSALRGES